MIVKETRTASRRKVLKAGSIILPNGGVIGCTIRNLSNSGAALEVTSPVGIPDGFSLMIEMEHRKRTCKVIWRRDRRIGVSFE
ncbi:MAG: PilZ domain-containing protein [Afipia sp.]|nr:PilZ domain-containing protein [Afipia sp.]